MEVVVFESLVWRQAVEVGCFFRPTRLFLAAAANENTETETEGYGRKGTMEDGRSPEDSGRVRNGLTVDVVRMGFFRVWKRER